MCVYLFIGFHSLWRLQGLAFFFSFVFAFALAVKPLVSIEIHEHAIPNVVRSHRHAHVASNDFGISLCVGCTDIRGSPSRRGFRCASGTKVDLYC